MERQTPKREDSDQRSSLSVEKDELEASWRATADRRQDRRHGESTHLRPEKGRTVYFKADSLESRRLQAHTTRTSFGQTCETITSTFNREPRQDGPAKGVPETRRNYYDHSGACETTRNIISKSHPVVALFTRCGCIGKSGPAGNLSTAREGHMVEMLLPNREKLVKCTL
jgi:hypothetical protein